MNVFWFMLIFASISFVNGSRSPVWPKEFNVSALSGYKKMVRYFATPALSTEYEDAAVHIQRRFVGYRFKNGTEWKDEEALSIPFVVIFTESKRWFDGDNRPTTRMFAIACTVLVLLGSLFAVVYTFRGIFLVASPVDVIDVYDRNKPRREMPSAVVMRLKKKREKSSTVSSRSSGSSDEKKSDKKGELKRQRQPNRQSNLPRNKFGFY